MKLDTKERIYSFVNSLDVATKIGDVVKTLPSDFAKNIWYLLYETYDQEGNIIDGVDDNIDKSRVTLVCDNYTLLKVETADDLAS